MACFDADVEAEVEAVALGGGDRDLVNVSPKGLLDFDDDKDDHDFVGFVVGALCPADTVEVVVASEALAGTTTLGRGDVRTYPRDVMEVQAALISDKLALGLSDCPSL